MLRGRIFQLVLYDTCWMFNGGRIKKGKDSLQAAEEEGPETATEWKGDLISYSRKRAALLNRDASVARLAFPEGLQSPEKIRESVRKSLAERIPALLAGLIFRRHSA